MPKSVSWYKPPWIHGGTLKNEQQKERIAELENFVVFAARSFARDAAFVQKTTEILAKGKDGEGRTYPDRMVGLPQKLTGRGLEGAT